MAAHHMVCGLILEWKSYTAHPLSFQGEDYLVARPLQMPSGEKGIGSAMK